MRRPPRDPYGGVVFRPLTRPQLAVDLVAAGVFLVVALLAELAVGRASAYELLGALLIAAGMSGGIAVRRLSPALALAAVWAAGIVQMMLGRTPSVSDLAVFAVLYATAAYGSRRVMWSGLASALLGAVIGTVYLVQRGVGVASTGGTGAVVSVLLAALFALLLSWTAGALVRTAVTARENRSAQERAEALAAVESERVQIARDMHDVVAHSLAVIVAQADGARYASSSDPTVATAALETIGTAARSALSDVRLLLTQLRHRQSDGPQPRLTDLEALYAQVRAAGLTLRVHVDPPPSGDPPAGVQLAVYRVLQESLTNALRHGTGGPVEVHQRWCPREVELTVRNAANGRTPAATGHGVLGMRERVQLVGGRLEAGPDGETFLVRATIPVGGAG